MSTAASTGAASRRCRGAGLQACEGTAKAVPHNAPRSNTAGISPRHALPGGRITGLGATLDFHHGLLDFSLQADSLRSHDSRYTYRRPPAAKCMRRPGVVRLSREWQSSAMTSRPPSYGGYRFPPEIVSHPVWLYYRFGLSFRDVEALLAERSITVTHEAIREWCLRFGLVYTRRSRINRSVSGSARCASSVRPPNCNASHRYTGS